MSIQPAKISEEEHFSAVRKEPPGYVERGVRWIARDILHLKLNTPKQFEDQDLIDKINNKMLCPIVLFRQFERRVSKSVRIEIFEKVGKNWPLSYKDRVWNWIFRDQDKVKRRNIEIGKILARKNPYLLATDLIKALLNSDNWPACQCSLKR